MGIKYDKIEEINKNINNNNSILFFDLDGTLIYTDEANFLSYQESVKKVKNIDLKLLYKSNKRFTQENLYSIIPSLTTQEYKDIIKIKKSLYNKYLNKTKINNLALKIINLFSKTNKIILVTNSSKERAMLVLEYHNLIDIFNDKFFKEDYEGQKISKFKYVLDYLNLTPSQTIVFENDKDEIKKAIFSGVLPNNIIDLKIQEEHNYE